MALDKALKKPSKAILIAKIPSILGVIFICLYLVKVISVQFELRYDSWVAGEWLINYSAGFIRRGLLGEIFLTLGSILNFHITSLVILSKVIVYLTIVAILLWISGGFNKKLGIAELTLLLSPWALMFDLIDIRGSGRKELILICSFLIFLLIQRVTKKQEGRSTNWIVFWYLIFLFPTLVLIHEGFIFFLPFFGIAIFFEDKSNLTSKIGLLAGPSVLAIFLFIWFYFQDALDARQAGQICLSLTERAIDKSICDGAIDALKYSLPVIPIQPYVRYYLPSIFLVSVPLLYYGVQTSLLGFKKTLQVVLIPLIAILPLLWVSFDWGRWIHTYGMMLLSFFLFIKRRDFSFKLPNHWITTIGLIAFGYLYLFGWRLKPFIGEDAELARMLFDVIKWLRALTGFEP